MLSFSGTKLWPSMVLISLLWSSVGLLVSYCSLKHFFIYVNKGESGLGKTTLINTLFSTELSSAKNYSRRHHKQLDKLTEVEIIKAELEEKQFKVKLTVIDTPALVTMSTIATRGLPSSILSMTSMRHT